MKLLDWTKNPWTTTAFRMLRSPRWEVECLKDLANSISTWAPWDPHRRPTNPASPVLTFQLFRDDIFDVKMMMMLGYAVREAGGQPVYVLPRATFARAYRLLQAVAPGPTFLQPAWEEPLPEELSQLAEKGNFEDFVHHRWEGLPLARLALSSSMRATRNTLPSVVMQNREELTNNLIEAWKNTMRARAMLDTYQPQAVCLTEPGYVQNGPLMQVATRRNIDVIYPTGSWRDDALLIKRYRGVQEQTSLPSSVDRSTFVRITQEPWTDEDDAALEHAFFERYGGKWLMQSTFQTVTAGATQTQEFHPHRRTDKKLAVIFCHVLWDATFWAGEDLFDDYAAWLSETVRVAIETTDVDWIIKTHPANAFRSTHGDVDGSGELRLLEETFGALPNHISIARPDAPISSLDLYQHADICLTVRGMPGFEMATFGKTVLTAGTGPYDRMGFTIDSDTQEEYKERLRNLACLAAPSLSQTVLAKRYALALFRDRPFIVRSFQFHLKHTKGGAFHPLDRNIRPVAGADKHPTDLHALGNWILHSTDIDWMSDWHGRGSLNATA